MGLRAIQVGELPAESGVHFRRSRVTVKRNGNARCHGARAIRRPAARRGPSRNDRMTGDRLQVARSTSTSGGLGGGGDVACRRADSDSEGSCRMGAANLNLKVKFNFPAAGD